MTGPEHYKAAEILLAAADKISEYLAGLADPVPTTLRPTVEAGERAMLTVTARAQVHATLALADNVGGVIDQLRAGVGP